MAEEFELSRFVDAQVGTYEQALAELRAGRKRSHWMWFVFPQMAGLGSSDMARRYAIRSAREARAYLDHPLLGARLRESTRAVLAHEGMRAEAIFGSIDAVKLRSSMTLFDQVGEESDPFAPCLDAFFGGERDAATLRLLAG